MANQVPIPPTTHNTVVFPLNIWNKEYDSTFYNPVLTDHRATAEEINVVLRQIEALKKPFNKKIVCALWLYILGLLAVIGLMVGGIIASVGGYSHGYYYYGSTGLLILSIVGGMIALIVVIVVFVVYVVKTTKASRVPVQNLFNTINPDFATRGLRWHLPIHFPRWVELWKDYVSLGAPYGQPVYMPPQQYQNYQVPPTTNNIPHVAPGTQPHDYQAYGAQPQATQAYGQNTFNNYNTNQA